LLVRVSRHQRIDHVGLAFGQTKQSLDLAHVEFAGLRLADRFDQRGVNIVVIVAGLVHAKQPHAEEAVVEDDQRAALAGLVNDKLPDDGTGGRLFMEQLVGLDCGFIDNFSRPAVIIFIAVTVGVVGQIGGGVQQTAIPAEQEQQRPMTSAQDIRQLEVVLLVSLVKIDTGDGMQCCLGWTQIHRSVPSCCYLLNLQQRKQW
jgi:hypothetical protein